MDLPAASATKLQNLSHPINEPSPILPEIDGE
jgi:hypothetical protein